MRLLCAALSDKLCRQMLCPSSSPVLQNVPIALPFSFSFPSCISFPHHPSSWAQSQSFFPLRVILPAWLVWHVELVDAADTLVRCGRARSAGCSDGDSKTLLMSLLRGQGGHVGRAEQTKLSPTLSQQKSGHADARTHINLNQP